MTDKIIAGYRLSELKEEALPGFGKTAREASSEGIVLLKNENSTLPLRSGDKVSVFGRIQFDYYKSGTGSGGRVNVKYITNITDCLRGKENIHVNEKLADVYAAWLADNPFDNGPPGWATEPWSQVEMPLSDEVVAAAAAESDVAIVVIGRTAGEDKDNYAAAGSYLLTDGEYDMIKKVSAAFERVCVVLNVGNIIDMKWVSELNVPSVLYVWHGGMEGGNSAADILCGDVTPSGKLSDTIAYDISDYPAHGNFGDKKANIYAEDIYVGYRYFETFAKDKVLYPFGFGLSYTTFSVKQTSFTYENGRVSVSVNVGNTGTRAGKEVVQLYVGAPQGKLGKPARVLAAFAKTSTLEPGCSEDITLTFNQSEIASYDDSGLTGNRSCYVLEAGEYVIYVGTDVRTAVKYGSFTLDELVVTQQLTEALAPVVEFNHLCACTDENGNIVKGKRAASTRKINLAERIAAGRPADIEYTGDRGIKLKDVAAGKHTLDEFVAQLSVQDLINMVKGEGMCSPKVTPGTAAATCGITRELRRFGIPAVCSADGPSGIRMDCGQTATSMPNGTLLACTWNLELLERLYTLEGLELYAYKIDALLAPGINIHRHPLNGRNFEYFSEDPYLTGKMAAAISRSIRCAGSTVVLKHFAANSQEFSRHEVDAIITERAAREIYLKAFEIAIKEGGASCIMTAYNPLNGITCAGSYDLNTTILRNEWGFDGYVMTDWWTSINDDGCELTYECMRNLSAMIRSQNDIYMVTADALQHEDDLHEALESGKISIGELQRSAKNLLSYTLNTPAFERLVNTPDSEMVDYDKADTLAKYDNAVIGKAFSFDAPCDGTYLVRSSLIFNESFYATAVMNIHADDKDIKLFTLTGTSGKAMEVDILIELSAGAHEITLVADNSNVSIVSLQILR